MRMFIEKVFIASKNIYPNLETMLMACNEGMV